MPKSKNKRKQKSNGAHGRCYPSNCIGRNVNGRLLCLTHGEKCPWNKRINGDKRPEYVTPVVNETIDQMAFGEREERK